MARASLLGSPPPLWPHAAAPAPSEIAVVHPQAVLPPLRPPPLLPEVFAALAPDPCRPTASGERETEGRELVARTSRRQALEGEGGEGGMGDALASGPGDDEAQGDEGMDDGIPILPSLAPLSPPSGGLRDAAPTILGTLAKAPGDA